MQQTCKCVRPILIMCSKAFDFSSRALCSSVRAGIRLFLISVTAATCIAVGNLQANQSQEDVINLKSHIRVVAALAHVNMIIGVDGFLGTQLTSQDLNCTVCDDLPYDKDLSKSRVSIRQLALPHCSSCCSASHFQSERPQGESGR